MLTLLMGTDWTANREIIMNMISNDVSCKKSGSILMVPELISHETERLLCTFAGDTASRYAEVLTFTRLANRISEAAGFGAPECLDNGGRLVAMASATRQLHSKLKAYASVETRPEFLTGLLDALDEFKRCCLSPDDLMNASKQSEGSFSQKLEELALVYEAYDSICAQGKCDPRDLMTWILEQLEESDFAEKHTFYIDGFPDFTRQHTAILHHLMTCSERVVVSLNCDRLDSSNPAFEKAASTASELVRLAKQSGVTVDLKYVTPKDNPFQKAFPNLFQGKIDRTTFLIDSLKTYCSESLYKECHAAAQRIVELVQSGCRYRDISVVCTDMSAYMPTLDMILSRYHIPFYQSGTEDILDMTVINTVLNAIDVAVNGFDRVDVLRYLKSSLSPLAIDEADKIENYAYIWNITGNKWFTQWENHPKGLGEDWLDEDRQYLSCLNDVRLNAMSPLLRLANSMKASTNLEEKVQSVYDFLDDIRMGERLDRMAAQMELDGDYRNAQILFQLWEILLSALEQLSDVLGNTYWDNQSFTKLLKLLLSQYDVGTIPAVLDAVTVGSFGALRCHQSEYLLVLGAIEGSFPSYSGSFGVLTDQERTALRQMGIPLTGGAIEGLQAEFSDIYGVFCGAVKAIYVSYSVGQPSFLYRRLSEMAGGEKTDDSLNFASTNMNELGAFLVRNQLHDDACSLGVDEVFHNLQKLTNHSFGQMNTDTVQKLYGKNLRLSASQIDKLADCRLAYFLKYGLKLKERKAATVDPAEFGTYVHAVLEDTGREIMRLGGFHEVSMEKTLEIAKDFSNRYITERFSQLDSQRLNYLFMRNSQELEMVVAELWNELQESSFEPVEFELGFGIPDGMNAVTISGKNLTAQLRGFVDRVDAWEQNGQQYYRVVDYKTGKKDFDYCDIFNGLGLQMLLYLFALEENGGTVLGEHPVAAGVQYFPARVPYVSVEGYPSDEEAVRAREKLWTRKGLLLEDEAVLMAMEPSEQPKRLCYSRKKDGTISGDLADRYQLQMLKGYIFALLGKMVDDIASGCVEPNPYTRGGRHNACSFCPYGSICNQATVPGRRNYAAMSSQKFWEEIEKEMRDHG